jgi:hypothetical protein
MEENINGIVYSSLNGRIGNNLFQIAAGVSLAHDLNAEFVAIPNVYYKIPENGYRHEHDLWDYLPQFRCSVLRNVEIQAICPDDVERYEETDFTFNELPRKTNIILEGYFQSEKYFNEQIVRKIFEIDAYTLSQIKDRYSFLFKSDYISINVRRGDYLSKQSFHPVCGKEYYTRAMDFFGNDRLFMVTSDDLPWCRSVFQGDNFKFAERTNPIMDLYIQSVCKNNIISNSTFGWWGAWLNPYSEKTVIAPQKWFGPSLDLDTKDLIPENWITI